MQLAYEWDEEKENYNIKKHGVDFKTASKVFDDEQSIEIYDEEHSTIDEIRYNIIGRVEDMLFVVYTERGERIRIISARLATKEEEELYYDRLLH